MIRKNTTSDLSLQNYASDYTKSIFSCWNLIANTTRAYKYTLYIVKLLEDQTEIYSKKEKKKNRYARAGMLRRNYSAGLVYLNWVPLT